MTRRAWRAVLVAVLLFAGLWAALAGPSRLPIAQARPAATYAEALARFQVLAGRDGRETNAACRSRLFTRGGRTGRVVVLLHGFTNCPKQFERLGILLHDAGANVLIPRVVRHGLGDRMTHDLAGLTGRELVDAAGEAVDIARGLGDTVVVIGLSSTAVAAAALAQTRSDIYRAVLLAPALAPRRVSAPLTRRVATLLIHAPNLFVWWDSKAKESLPGPAQAYPRFPTRALGEIYRLGSQVLDAAGRERPAARSIAVVTTAADRAVNNGTIAELTRRWRARGGAVTEHEFPANLRVNHDMIEPEQLDARVDAVYPVVASFALSR
jgi:alpha-beta hydrolase superfamily lysophospholipase